MAHPVVLRYGSGRIYTITESNRHNFSLAMALRRWQWLIVDKGLLVGELIGRSASMAFNAALRRNRGYRGRNRDL